MLLGNGAEALCPLLPSHGFGSNGSPSSVSHTKDAGDDVALGSVVQVVGFAELPAVRFDHIGDHTMRVAQRYDDEIHDPIDFVVTTPRATEATIRHEAFVCRRLLAE